MQILFDSLTSTQAGITIALLVLFLAWETIHPFFGFFRGHAKERGRHLFRNLALALLNSVVVALGFIALWAGAAAWADARDLGLLHLWTDAGAARVIAAVLILDVWNYVWHRLNHAVPFLWRFHSVHHSDPLMDVSTSGRYHVGEILIGSLLLVPVLLLLGVRLWEMLLYQVLAAAVGQFHHANISVPPAVDRILRLMIVTPAMHKVHHSRVRQEMNSNFSSLLSLWDRLGRTFRLAGSPREIAFGVDRLDAPENQTIGGLLRMPLRTAARPDENP